MKNNAEIIKGIENVITGLNMIKSAMGEVADSPVEEKAVSSKVGKTKAEVKEEVKSGSKKESSDAGVSEESLRSMKYNDFKKYASSLGVDCKGTRDEIMERVLKALAGGVEEAPEKEEVAKKDSKSAKPVGGKKLGKKEDKEEEQEESDTDEFDEQAEEIANETSLEDIIEALADVKIKATKKNAVEKLAHALREGLIELDGDDEEDSDDEQEDSDEEADEDGEEISADSYFEQYDPSGYNDPENMTDERKEAIETKMDEILTEISEGTLTSEEITSFIEDVATEAEIDLLGEDYSDEDLIAFYMEMMKRFINNEGETCEMEDPYEVGDVNFCCGHELKYVKKNKTYVCEKCGAEYDAE